MMGAFFNFRRRCERGSEPGMGPVEAERKGTQAGSIPMGRRVPCYRGYLPDAAYHANHPADKDMALS